MVNGKTAGQGMAVTGTEVITLDNKPVAAPSETKTILFNKPKGYVVSRDGQGSRTIYDLLPPELHRLKPVGRLDKNSSGLLLLTNDGQLAEQLTHPRYGKVKIYEVTLNKDLAPLHRQMIAEMGVQLEDGPSRLGLERLQDGNEKQWRVTMSEGRNRQIRRTFAALGYDVVRLHRTHFGNYTLGGLRPGDFTPLQT
jgi:23S rRNA pseudouridine2605 synthase